MRMCQKFWKFPPDKNETKNEWLDTQLTCTEELRLMYTLQNYQKNWADVNDCFRSLLTVFVFLFIISLFFQRIKDQHHYEPLSLKIYNNLLENEKLAALAYEKQVFIKDILANDSHNFILKSVECHSIVFS